MLFVMSYRSAVTVFFESIYIIIIVHLFKSTEYQQLIKFEVKVNNPNFFTLKLPRNAIK